MDTKIRTYTERDRELGRIRAKKWRIKNAEKANKYRRDRYAALEDSSIAHLLASNMSREINIHITNNDITPDMINLQRSKLILKRYGSKAM